MSEQREQGSLERKMDKAPDGPTVDLQDVARNVTSGNVEAEEQPTPEDEKRQGNDYPFNQADREKPS